MKKHKLISLITIVGLSAGVLTHLTIGQAKGLDTNTQQSLNTVGNQILSNSKALTQDQPSYALAPNLYVPSWDMLPSQTIDPYDVMMTAALEESKFEAEELMSQLQVPLAELLGVDERLLTSVDLEQYRLAMERYSESLTEVIADGAKPYAVDLVKEMYLTWISNFESVMQDTLTYRNGGTNYSSESEVSDVVQLDGNLISEEQMVSYGIPNLKDQYLTYMPYTAITATTTPHYRLQQVATTDEEGYRTYAGARCVALASSYGTKIGTVYEIYFDDGKVLNAILCDNKSDAHTDSKNQYRDATNKYNGSSGNIVEIVFDTTGFSDVNSVNRKINSDYPGHVIAIIKTGVAEGF